jgi:pimeloyl-ACP methyl ester carboxylesterase
MWKALVLISFILLTTTASAVTDFDLTDFDEESFLARDKKPKLLPLADKKHPYDESKLPLILVHGIRGNPKDLQGVVNRFKDSHFQIYVLVYEDYKRRATFNGNDLAPLISKFKKFDEITIVAHSMGGIIVRKALVELVKKSKFENHIRFFSVDTPWHGFDGPGDDGHQMFFARPFLPDALEDMRARSALFKEFNVVTFPDNIEVDLAFAEEGEEAFGPLEINARLVIPEQFINFENALKMSRQTEIPTFPGNHMTVLQGPYLDYLQQRIMGL